MADIQVQNKDGVAPDHNEVAGSDHKPLPTQTDSNKTKKFMDAKFYKAAVNGNIKVLENKQADHDRLLTPCDNTILHIHILARTPEMESTQFLQKALDMFPPLLFQANIKGETPLHMAARYGHDGVVKVLIERAKSLVELERGCKQQMLWVTNNEEDTALHEAVRMNHIEVVRLLIAEDREHSYSANGAGETPLYLAVHRGYDDIASEILERCTRPTHQGPRGTTTLHAAVFTQNYAMTQKLLDKTGCTLTSEVDDDGWTPLHYSARNGSIGIFVALLEKDKSAAYIPCKKEQWTPLHVAIRYRRFKMMKELIEQCPDCAEVVDRRGWNAFHHAVDAHDGRTLRSLLKHSVLGIQLINDKDEEGNTPLHHVASTPRGYDIADVIFKPPVVDKNALNKEKQTPLDLLSSEDDGEGDFQAKVLELISNKPKLRNGMQENGCRESVRSKIIEEKNYGERLEPTEKKPLDVIISETMEAQRKRSDVESSQRRREAQLVVATLIATVTFAAGFTLPGGYISDEGPDQGVATLSRKVAFQVFIVSDTIAMTFSTCAVLIHLCMASEFAQLRSTLKLLSFFACILTAIAMEAMVVSFATGTYAVLDHSKSLAISVVIISTSSFYYFGFQTLSILLYDLLYRICGPVRRMKR